jgi:hypothetical protein
VNRAALHRSFALAAAMTAMTGCSIANPRACSVVCGDLGQCPDGTSCGAGGFCYGPDDDPGSCEAGSEPDAAVVEEPDASTGGEPDAAPDPPDAGPGDPDACDGADSFSGENGDDVAIPDNDRIGIESAIAVVAGCAAVESVQVRVDIIHSFRGDLRVGLTSPEGSSVTLVEPEANGSDDIHETFDVDIAAGESPGGDWVLTVSDTAAQDLGRLDRWSIGINQLAP